MVARWAGSFSCRAVGRSGLVVARQVKGEALQFRTPAAAPGCWLVTRSRRLEAVSRRLATGSVRVSRSSVSNGERGPNHPRSSSVGGWSMVQGWGGEGPTVKMLGEIRLEWNLSAQLELGWAGALVSLSPARQERKKTRQPQPSPSQAHWTTSLCLPPRNH